LVGKEVAQVSISDVVRAGTADLEASSDLHATADYRRRVAAVLGTRALEDAFAEARSRNGAVQ
jgi:CO/xanthine dehydrogenase FAD-binding subunit